MHVAIVIFQLRSPICTCQASCSNYVRPYARGNHHIPTTFAYMHMPSIMFQLRSANLRNPCAVSVRSRSYIVLRKILLTLTLILTYPDRSIVVTLVTTKTNQTIFPWSHGSYKTFYFFLCSWAGGILQILWSDWFRERAVFSNPARSQRAVSVARWIVKCTFSAKLFVWTNTWTMM